MEASLRRLAPYALVLLFGVASILAEDNDNDKNDDAAAADDDQNAQTDDDANAWGDDDQVFDNYVPTTTHWSGVISISRAS